jgi:hypothetical protein
MYIGPILFFTSNICFDTKALISQRIYRPRAQKVYYSELKASLARHYKPEDPLSQLYSGKINYGPEALQIAAKNIFDELSD